MLYFSNHVVEPRELAKLSSSQQPEENAKNAN